MLLFPVVSFFVSLGYSAPCVCRFRELIDVSEIPQPLEGDEVQRRTDFYWYHHGQQLWRGSHQMMRGPSSHLNLGAHCLYSEELMDTSMPLPANTMRRWELNTGPLSRN
jgi:hypothetical protein